MLKKALKSSTAVAIALLLGVGAIAYAASYYQVGSGTTVRVNEYSTCKDVKNNNGNAIFVPTNSSAEWTAFRNNASGVQLTDCDYYYWVALGEQSDGPAYVTCSVHFTDGSSISTSGWSGPPSYYYIGSSAKTVSYEQCIPGTEWENFFACPTSGQCSSPTP